MKHLLLAIILCFLNNITVASESGSEYSYSEMDYDEPSFEEIIYDLNTIIPIIEDLDTQDLDLDQTGLFTEPNYIMDSVSSVIDEINNKIEMLSSSNTSGLETDDLKHFYEACRRFALFLTKIDRYDEALLIIDKIDFSDLRACALIDI